MQQQSVPFSRRTKLIESTKDLLWEIYRSSTPQDYKEDEGRRHMMVLATYAQVVRHVLSDAEVELRVGMTKANRVVLDAILQLTKKAVAKSDCCRVANDIIRAMEIAPEMYRVFVPLVGLRVGEEWHLPGLRILPAPDVQDSKLPKIAELVPVGDSFSVAIGEALSATHEGATQIVLDRLVREFCLLTIFSDQGPPWRERVGLQVAAPLYYECEMHQLENKIVVARFNRRELPACGGLPGSIPDIISINRCERLYDRCRQLTEVDILLKEAAYWIGKSIWHSGEMGFIAAAIAVESMLIPERSSSAGKTEMLKGRLVHLLAQDIPHAEKIEKWFGEFYDERSRIVHAGSVRVSTQRVEIARSLAQQVFFSINMLIVAKKMQKPQDLANWFKSRRHLGVRPEHFTGFENLDATPYIKLR